MISTYTVQGVVKDLLVPAMIGAPEAASQLAIASLCGDHYVAGLEPRLVPLSTALYHTYFICELLSGIDVKNKVIHYRLQLSNK